MGYDLPTAIADLIDNSLSAGARNIDLTFRFADGDSWIRVGTTASACRRRRSRTRCASAASTLVRRAPNVTTVVSASAQDGLVQSVPESNGPQQDARVRDHHLVADLDHVLEVNRWDLLLGTPDGQTDAVLGEFVEGRQGTVVLWEKVDRVLTGTTPKKRHEDFDRKILDARRHLAMVFHRFLDHQTEPVRIVVNGVPLAGWDPLLSRHPKTRQVLDERIPLRGSRVHVVPYVLPQVLN